MGEGSEGCTRSRSAQKDCNAGRARAHDRDCFVFGSSPWMGGSRIASTEADGRKEEASRDSQHGFDWASTSHSRHSSCCQRRPMPGQATHSRQSNSFVSALHLLASRLPAVRVRQANGDDPQTLRPNQTGTAPPQLQPHGPPQKFIEETQMHGATPISIVPAALTR